MTSTPRIVVLGAGYAGLAAAKLLAKRTGASVTLVNNRDRFVERMRNHQLAAGREPRQLLLPKLVEGTGIRLIIDHVTRIDPAERRIELANAAEPVDYDLLVNALGSRGDLETVPGAAEHADAVATAEQAMRLRDRMRTAGVVAVVGGGATGIEVATELAESYPDRTVRLATSGGLGEALSEPARDYLHRAMERFGIQVWEHARVAKVGEDGLLLADGTHVPAEAVAWTTGFQVSDLAREAGLAVDHRGQMLVDATMRSESHPEVYGIGDVAAIRNYDGQVLRMGCGPGGLSAVSAFHAIRDRMAGRTPKPLRFPVDALLISLGQRDALLQPTELDGTPRGKVRTGRSVAMAQRAVLRTTGWAYPVRPGLVAAGSIGRA
jgi:NADH dehydrogenase